VLNNSNRELLTFALQNLGGRLVRSVDLQTGEVLGNFPTELEPQLVQSTNSGSRIGAVAGGLVPLSSAHKRTQGGTGGGASNAPSPLSPFVEWRDKASILKVSKAEPTKQTGGGLRGVVKGFSRGSRRRLMSKIAGVRRDAKLPVFVTLTYPKAFPEPKQSKYHLKVFILRMKRAFPDAGIIWKLEPQKRGAPHYHLLVWGSSEKNLRAFVPTAWHEIAGGGDDLHLLWHEGKLKNKHCVNAVYSFKGVWSYASKYLGKTFEVAGWDSVAVGRFWAVVKPANIPFGEVQTRELSRADAVQVMRYQKRFAKLKSRSYPSITIFCDSEQWIDKVIKKSEVQ
jgi:hypothetical protein